MRRLDRIERALDRLEPPGAAWVIVDDEGNILSTQGDKPLTAPAKAYGIVSPDDWDRDWPDENCDATAQS